MTDQSTLDSFYPNILSKEPSVRLECFSAFETHLSDENTSLECDDLTGLIDGLLRWIEGSNFKVRFDRTSDRIEDLFCRLHRMAFEL